MSSETEARIERRFVAGVQAMGGVATKLLVRHWPDRLVVLPGGRVFFVELKRPGGVVSPGQHVVLSLLRGLGCFAEVFDNDKEALWWLANGGRRTRTRKKW